MVERINIGVKNRKVEIKLLTGKSLIKMGFIRMNTCRFINTSLGFTFTLKNLLLLVGLYSIDSLDINTKVDK